MDKYMIDFNLQPTTFDFWHVCLAATVVILAISVILLLVSLVICLTKSAKKSPAITASEPTIKIVEKIVEVEKIVQAPAPEPIVLKEASADAALQLLGLLQKSARFIDFIQEDLTAYNDADIGVAARVVHEGCRKVIQEHFNLETIRQENEGSKITLAQGFDASLVRLTGNIVGNAPFSGHLIHKGWRITHVNLPKLTAEHDANIIAPAEVEL